MPTTIRNSAQVCVFAFLFLGAASQGIAALSFLEPRFTTLDVGSLEKRLSELSSASDSGALAERAIVLFHLAEHSGLEKKIHRQREQGAELRALCADFEGRGFQGLTAEDTATVQAACLLNHPKTTLKDWEALRSSIADPAERFFLEGRFLSTLPPERGGDERKALVAFHFLKRLRPELSSADFRIAEIHEKWGKPDLGLQAFKSASTKFPRDGRLKFYLDSQGENIINQRNRLDGLGYGFSFGGGWLAGEGLWGKVGYLDASAFDKGDSFETSFRASVLGNYDAMVAYLRHPEPSRIGFEMRLRRSQSNVEFTGLGPFSDLNEKTRMHQSLFHGALSLRRALNDAVAVSLGWRVDVFGLSGEAMNLGELPFVSDGILSGPAFFLSWDTRDSANNPRVGAFTHLSGFFPVPGLGSRFAFERWDLELQKHWLFGFSHRLSLRFHGAYTRGQVPIAYYPSLGRNVFLMGVRPGRFIDAMLLGLNPSYSWFVYKGISLQTFATFAGVGGQEPLAHGLHWIGGGGVALEWRAEVRSASGVRLEAGILREETVVQARAAVDW